MLAGVSWHVGWSQLEPQQLDQARLSHLQVARGGRLIHGSSHDRTRGH